MSGQVESFTFSPALPLDRTSLGALREVAESALAGGARRLILNLDGLEVLEAPAISGLIAVLRLARERGAEVHLAVSHPGILGTLKVTGLDKLFAVGPPPATSEVQVAARPAKRLRARPAVTASAVVLAAALVLGARATATTDPAPPPSEIVTHLTTLNPAMRTYQARLSVDFQLRTFPYIGEHLEGTTYFKRPGSYEVVFSKVPSYAKGFDKLYTDAGDPSSWERRFNMSVVGERSFNGHRDLVMRLVQRVRGMIDHEDVLVDPRTWHVDNMEWHYYNGGVISMSQEYELVDGFSVMKAQHATIRIPFVHASAEGRYNDYRTNVPIDDAVFTKESHA